MVLHLMIAAAAAATIAPAIDRSALEQLRAANLAGHLVGSRMHDPECETRDGCDEVFLPGGRVRRSISSTEWETGAYTIVEDGYCTRFRGIARCFELWTGPTIAYLRVPVGGDTAAPMIVHLIPASR